MTDASKTQLIESHQISRRHRFYAECDRLTYLSKNLWNATNYAVRQHLFSTGEYLNYNQVNLRFTHENQADYRALPAKVAKGTQRLLDKSYRSFFKKSGFRHIPGYLHKTHGRQLVHYERGALSFRQSGFIKLSKTNILIKSDKQADFVRIVPHLDYFTIEIGYTVANPAPSETTGNVASIDFGMKNFATITSNVSAPIIINGLPIRSINSYAKRLIEQHRQYTHGSSHLTRSIYRKRHNKLKDYYHKSSRFVVDWLVDNQITSVVIGRNLGWKQGNYVREFQQTAYNTFTDMLTYKCHLVGIDVILQEESYTSKASFKALDNIPTYGDNVTIAFSGKRIKRGLYKNADNTVTNADVNGSLNILRKSPLWHDDMYAQCLPHSIEPIIRYNF
jgi:transposase, IS605 OrfB family, central region